MTLTDIYVIIMEPIKDVLIISFFISLTIALIVMLGNMIINAAIGKGFTIGLK